MLLAEISFDLSRVQPFSVIVAVVGYVTVFAALVFMYYTYRYLPEVIKLRIRQRLLRQGKGHHSDEAMDVSGEVIAAIAAALHLHFDEKHDVESEVVTIKKVSKRYSPWSSKIYGLNSYKK